MSFLGKNESVTKSRVYLSVTPGVGIELIQVDLKSNTVANYAFRELAYNDASREIVDYDNFKNAVSDLYVELGINPKVGVVVNLPLVTFGTMQLGLLLPNDAITGAIQGEIEQTYIFRRSEPAVDWMDVPNSASSTPGKETRQVLYSAIQKPVIEKIAEALAELGSTLVRIENSLSSTFRALEYMGVASAQMEPNTTWNLMIINSVGYSVISLSGKNVIDYYEEPLPIKSFEENEIYDAIANSAQIALSNYPANYLYVISDTDQVSAEALVSKINIMGSIDFLENNAYKKQDSLIPVSLNILQSYASKISLQAIGCALSDVSDFPLKFNYMSENFKETSADSCTIAIGEHEYTLTRNGALMISAIFFAVVLGIFALLSFLVIPNAVASQQEKVDNLETELKTAKAQLDDLKGNSGSLSNFDLKREVEMGVKGNRAKLMNFVAVGDVIPKDVWLTYFMTQGNGLVDIKGGANDVSSIYVFFKNMRDSLIGTKLKLQKLEMDSQSVEAAVAGANANYTFEITNMTDAELTAFNTPAQNETQTDDNQKKGKKNPTTNRKNSTSKSSSSNPVPNQDLISSEPIQQ